MFDASLIKAVVTPRHKTSTQVVAGSTQYTLRPSSNHVSSLTSLPACDLPPGVQAQPVRRVVVF